MCLLTKKFVGLDIADSSIEIAEVKGRGLGAKVESLGRVILEKGIVEGGRIKDPVKLLEAIKQVFVSAKPRVIKTKEIVFGLPESQVYLSNFVINKESGQKSTEKIINYIKTSVPLEENDLLFAYKILKEDKDKLEILSVSASQAIVWEWQDFFVKNKIQVKMFDVEILASFRDLFRALPVEPVLVIDIGAHTSFLAIFDSQGLHYEKIISLAGGDFTSAISQALNIPLEKAEEEKIKSGLNNKNKKVAQAILEKIEELTREIKNIFEFYQEQSGLSISKIILVGGSSQMIGLDEYLSKSLGLPVQVGVAQTKNNKTPLEFVEAIGLARRALEKNWDKTDPILPLLKFPPIDKKKKTEIKFIEEEITPVPAKSQGKSLRWQLLSLFLVLFLGAGLIYGTLWYKNTQKEQARLLLESRLRQIPQVDYQEKELESDFFVENILASITEAVTTTNNIGN